MTWVDTDFFDQTFGETLTLLEETRNQVDMATHGGLRTLPTDTMLRTVRDLSYLTSQVTGIMSLLLLHRAVADGEIPEEELESRATMLVDEIGETEKALENERLGLSPHLLALIERGERLSQRIHRIQHMLDTGAA